MDIPDCDKEIWEKGEHVFSIYDGMKCADIEDWVKNIIAKESGQRVDWYYFGGVAVVKVIGDCKKVCRVIKKHIPFEANYRFTTETDSVIPMSIFKGD